ncbi:oligosaccharide flippase family protein [Planobispora siamensis]|nr:oligosaccharide flippase family protein [Planobispora siamensis]
MSLRPGGRSGITGWFGTGRRSGERRRAVATPMLVNAVASGVSASTTLLVAWGVSAAEFGRFTLVLSIALIVTVGMVMSLHFVMYQELPRSRPEEHRALISTALLSTLVLGTALALAGVLAAPVLTAVLGVDLRTLCFALALALAMAVNYLTESFLRGLRKYGLTSALKIIVAFVYLGVSAWFLFVLDVRDVDWYLLALIGTNLLFALVSAVGFRIDPRSWSRALARSLYRHGAYLTALGGLSAVLFGVDVIFLNHWAEASEVGVYSIYNNFPKRLLGVVFADGIGLVLLPALAVTDTSRALGRIGRLSPAVFAAAALLSFAASAVFFLLLRGEYPYSFGLMALSALGIGTHTVFNLYSAALSMDGVRGARALIAAQCAAAPIVLAGQAALIAWQGLAGGLVAFILSNLVLTAAVVIVSARVYRSRAAAPSVRHPEVPR